MNVLPTLTIDGFVVNREILITKLFQYFLASDSNQSNTFYGKIKSLKKILKEYSTPQGVANEVRKQLEVMYREYFDTAEVLTDYEEDNVKNVGFVNIKVDIVAYYNNKLYELSDFIKYNKAANIIEFDAQLDTLYYAQTPKEITNG